MEWTYWLNIFIVFAFYCLLVLQYFSLILILCRVVEWLDEYHPGSFRQAQVSFSTRIPSAFPLGDATTMSNNVCLYHTSGCHLQLVFRDVVKTAAAATTKTASSPGKLLSVLCYYCFLFTFSLHIIMGKVLFS